MTATLYGHFLTHLADGDVDLSADTIRATALTSSYTPDFDNDEFWDDISANEASGTGYTAGGATLGSKTLTYDGATNTTKFDAADVSWTTATFNARYIALVKWTGTPSTSILIGLVDFGSTRTLVGSDWTIAWNAAGVLTLV